MVTDTAQNTIRMMYRAAGDWVIRVTYERRQLFDTKVLSYLMKVEREKRDYKRAKAYPPNVSWNSKATGEPYLQYTLQYTETIRRFLRKEKYDKRELGLAPEASCIRFVLTPELHYGILRTESFISSESFISFEDSNKMTK
ncbi:hypothetical protein SK128_011550 [Halocaridina rubra]|uniref:Uncharacterized protein n=1 Tax=Halocaridina rubra TaxID=373956 RepID=A0AAN8WYX3_HALRR